MGPCTKPRWPWSARGKTRRIGEKKGRKRSLLVDGRGVPLSVIASGANVHDVKLLPATLERIVVARPQAPGADIEHLCGDAGYKGAPAQAQVLAHGYQPHIKQRKEEAQAKREGCLPRRWVVERTHSWFNRFRKLLVSFEKSEQSYLGLTCLAAALICWRQCLFIYG
jgi:transposase